MVTLILLYTSGLWLADCVSCEQLRNQRRVRLRHLMTMRTIVKSELKNIIQNTIHHTLVFHQ